MILKDFLTEWLANVIKNNVKASTYMVYRGYVFNHIIPLIGEIELMELKTQVIQIFISKLMNNDKKNLSAKTINAILAMLNSALQCAIEYEHLGKNPCAKARLPKPKEKEIKVFTRAEQEKIEKTIMDSNDSRNLGVLICLYTGIRIGELCALRWSDLDLKKRLLNIRLSLNRVSTYDNDQQKTKLVFEEPKTDKSKRLLPIAEFLWKLLVEQKKKSNSMFILSMKNGKAVQPRTMQYIYARLLKAANVEYRNFHALRHTFATRVIELGVDIKTVSETLGHSNSVITINRYSHSLMEQKQKMMSQLNTFYTNKKHGK